MNAIAVFILLAATFVTATISGIFGMAGGLLLMGVLALILPVSAAMVVHGTIQSVSNGWRAVILRNWIAWRILTIYLIGSAAAAGLLIWLTFELDKAWLFIALGLVPGIIWIPRQWLHLDASKPVHAIACGFSVTGLNVIAGVSGPLLDVFFAETEVDRRAIVATKAATQVVSHGVKIGYYILPALSAGALPAGHWLMLAIPLAILGTTLGTRVLNLMSDIQFRQWTKWIVSAIGLVYIVRGLLLLAGTN
ncbi:sulfite exporter TauE/SafE family protein [Maricaulis sp.]|uniref:sulfite exporter TauE/SafE family protein n=1 Tax=Maricaulis sp. TaxID=1486257 RepID=UPI002627E0BD|nr:sulfite exporter TauE/SafE family protein [Maricaulis sp.]